MGVGVRAGEEDEMGMVVANASSTCSVVSRTKLPERGVEDEVEGEGEGGEAGGRDEEEEREEEEEGGRGSKVMVGRRLERMALAMWEWTREGSWNSSQHRTTTTGGGRPMFMA